MKKLASLTLILFLIFVTLVAGQELLFEGDWQDYALKTANLTGEKLVHIYPSSPNSDKLEYSKGSDSLNDPTVAENWNGIQLSVRSWMISGSQFGDGSIHYLLDNQGTGAGQDRVQLFIDGAGLLTFDVDDTDSTQHLLSYDISAWLPGAEHQVVATLDFKNDTMELYVDGASVDDTPDNPLSGDSIGTIEANSHVGKDTNDTNQLNGYMTFQLFNRVWSDAEISADYDSGDGTAFVVDPDTILMGNYSVDTGALYWHRGCTVSAIVDNGNDATLTTPANSDNRFPVDGEQVLVSDATGYGKYAFMDGVGSDTSITVDDGAGAAVGDIEKVGVSLDFDGSEYVDCGDDASLDIVATLAISAWIKPETIAVGSIASRDDGVNRNYGLQMQVNGTLNFYTFSGGAPNNRNIASDTVAIANQWIHVVGVYDGANTHIYINGISDATPQADVGAIDNDDASFTIGAQEDGVDRIFDGNISEVQVFNIALTAADVLWLATHPNPTEAEIIANTTVAATETVLYHNYRTQTLLDQTAYANDGTHSGTPTYDTAAFVSKSLITDGDAENGGIGAISDASIDSTITVTKDTTEVFADTQSLKVVYAASNDNVELEIAAPTLVSSGDYWNKFYAQLGTRAANSQIFVDVDGSATPILTRQLAGVADNGEWIGQVLTFTSASDESVIAEASIPAVFPYTASLWFKVNTTASGILFFIGDKDNANNYWTLATGLNGGNLEPSLFYKFNNATDNFSKTLNINQWYHIVVVWASNTSRKLYVDGVLVDTATVSRAVATGANRMAFGRSMDSTPVGSFDGSISEVQVYNIALTQADITWLYQNPNPTVTEIFANTSATETGGAANDDLVLYHNYGTASLTDLSEYVNDGTHSGTPTYESEWGLLEQCFQADQAAITEKLRISGLPEVVADSATLNTGTDTSGSVTDTYTQNGSDWVITEVTGSPGFDLEFDFTADGAKSFHLYGYYDGNIGHVVDVNAWNGASYDTLGQIPDAVGDTLYDFTLTDAHTVAGAVNIQIDHSSPGNVNHDLYMDHVYLIDGNSATVYLDNGELRENLIVNGGMEGTYAAGLAPGWTAIGGPTLTEENALIHSGVAAQKSAGDGGSGLGFSQNINVVVGAYYTVSAYYRTALGRNSRFYVQSLSWGGAINNLMTTESVLYIKDSFTFKADAATIQVRFYGTEIYVDDVSLIQVDEMPATATKGSGYVPLRNPLRPPGD